MKGFPVKSFFKTEFDIFISGGIFMIFSGIVLFNNILLFEGIFAVLLKVL
jgi:hypothetical protein